MVIKDIEKERKIMKKMYTLPAAFLASSLLLTGCAGFQTGNGNDSAT